MKEIMKAALAENERRARGMDLSEIWEKVRALAIDLGVLAEGIAGSRIKDAAAQASAISGELAIFIDAKTADEEPEPPGKKPDAKPTVSPETATRLRRLGLSSKYVGVENEDQLLELRETDSKSK